MAFPLHSHWLSLKVMKYIFPPVCLQALLSSVSTEHIYECRCTGNSTSFKTTEKGANKFVMKQTLEMPCFTPQSWQQKPIPKNLKINHV